jgi:acyl transferase domain-containing protein
MALRMTVRIVQAIVTVRQCFEPMDIKTETTLSSTKRALLALEQLQEKLNSLEAAQTEPIAIVGMGCRFPGGIKEVESFWQMLAEGKDGITRVPCDRWNIEDYYHPDPQIPGKICALEGGFLEEIDRFDADFFNLSPREAICLDPQQRLVLEVSWEALEQACIIPQQLFNSLTGVFLGIGTCDYARHLHQAAMVDAYTGTGTSFSVAAGRLSYVLGLTGPSLAVDTACSSSLVAVHLACQSLRLRECHLALAGGVNLILSPETSVVFSQAGMLAPDGRCKAFDAAANGYVRSEGCGVIVLKRLSDAQEMGDRILAVIRGSAVNQDGPSGGLTVPNGPAQVAVIRRALENSKVDPAQVSYIEAHGTGTSLGDPIEMRALATVFGANHTIDRPLTLGSVKTNLGHTECAAGIAGLIKVVLQLQHQTIVPHLHWHNPNPHIDWTDLPIVIPTKQKLWQTSDHPRIAGVSSFGFSGTNAHIVLGEFGVSPTETLREWGSEFGVKKLKIEAEKLQVKAEKLQVEGRDSSLGEAGQVGLKNDSLKVEPWSLEQICKDSKFPTSSSNFQTPDSLCAKSLQEKTPTANSELGTLNLLILSAKTKQALTDLVVLYEKYLEFCSEEIIAQNQANLLKDICMTAALGRSQFQYRLALLVKSVVDCLEKLRMIRQGNIPANCWLSSGSQEVMQNLDAGSAWENGNAWKIDRATAQDLMQLAQFYVVGETVDWQSFYEDIAWHRMTLPSYPFQRQRYWVEPRVKEWEERSPFLHSPHHPLLGSRLQLPFLAQIRFQSQISTQTPAHQAHHRLYGINILAAASQIALLLTAVQQGIGEDSCCLGQVMFLRPLMLSEEEVRSVQVVITGHTEGLGDRVFQVEVISLPTMQGGDSEWVQHVTGQIKTVAGDKTQTEVNSEPTPDPQIIQQRCSHILSKTEVYEGLYQAGYTLGTAFQWIAQVWRGEGEALGELRIPELPDRVIEYPLYPGLIDGCFQLLASCLSTQEREEIDQHQFIFVPFQIEQFEFFQQPQGQSLWCHVIRRTSGIDSNSFVGDLFIFDPLGNWIAKIRGYQVRRVTRKVLESSLQTDRQNWFYHLDWQAKTEESGQVQKTLTGRWLLFVPNLAIGEALAKALRDLGCSCILVFPIVNNHQDQVEESVSIEVPTYKLAPTDRLGFQNLIQELQENSLSLEGILHLWSLDQSSLTLGDSKDALTREALKTTQALSCASVLYLIQALKTSKKLWLITQGAQPVGELPHLLQVHQAPLWGLGRTIVLEHPELNCGCLDLDPVVTDGDAIEPLVTTLIEELRLGDQENQVAYRQGVRYVARLVHQDASNVIMSQTAPIRAQGSYLITGGLGALGLQVANWLVNHGARQLVLVGRREPSDVVQQQIQKWQTEGVAIWVAATDVSQESAVIDLIQAIETNFLPLRGIVHGAGVLEDGVLAGLDWQQFERVLAPKVQGAWFLHRSTQHLNLDFFVCFSSIASLLGSPGQSNYSAANAFLDALAHHRQALGLPAVTISWGPWAEMGMTNHLKPWQKERFQSQGIQLITPSQALASWLSFSQPQVALFPVDWSRFLQQDQHRAQSPFFSEILATISPKVAQISAATLQQSREFLQRLKSVNLDRRQQLLVIYLTETLAQILGRDSDHWPDSQEGFFNLGMDSLMAVELSQKLQTELEVQLSTTVFFEYANIEELGAYLGEAICPPEANNLSHQEPNQLQQLYTWSDSSDSGKSIDHLSDEELENSIDRTLHRLEMLLQEA